MSPGCASGRIVGVLRVVVVVAALLSVAPAVAHGEPDTEAPTVTSVEVSPDSVDVSSEDRTVRLTLHVTDSGSGVRFVGGELERPAGTRSIGSSSMQLVSGTSAEGVWQGAFVIPRYAEPGEWRLAIYGEDGADNDMFYSSQQLREAGLSSSLLVEDANPDTEPPRVTLVELAPNPVNVSAESRKVELTLHVTDNLSGVRFVLAQLESRPGYLESSGVHLVSGTSSDGIWQSTFTIAYATKPSELYLHISAGDTVENYVSYDSQSLQEAGLQNTLQVRTGPLPDVAKIAPKEGPAAGGTRVTLTGTNLTGATSVYFGGIEAASVELISSRQMVAVSPPGISGDAAISIVTPEGRGGASAKAVFKYDKPTVTSVAPSIGSIAGGGTITVRGSGFEPGEGRTTIAVGNSDAKSVLCSSTTECTATVPAARKPGVVDVRVAVGKLKSKKGQSDRYTYE